jgi:hypothetical protein
MILHEISNQLNQLNAPNQPAAFSVPTFQPPSFQAVDSINPINCSVAINCSVLINYSTQFIQLNIVRSACPVKPFFLFNRGVAHLTGINHST